MSGLRAGLAALMVAGFATAPAAAQSPAPGDAETLAEAFLDRVESGAYEDAYALFTETVRETLQAPAFRANMVLLAAQLGGPAEERALVVSRVMESVPGPRGTPIEGEFLGLRFISDYPAGRYREHIVLERADTGWAVVGYFWAEGV